MESPNIAPDSFSAEPAPQKNNTGLIVGIIVAVILLCCCCLSLICGYYIWNNY